LSSPPYVNLASSANTGARGHPNGAARFIPPDQPPKSFLDPQIGAQTHHFEHSPQALTFSQQSTSNNGTYEQNLGAVLRQHMPTGPVPHQNHKRKRDADSDPNYNPSSHVDVSQDAGFQQPSPTQPKAKKSRGRPPTQVDYQTQLSAEQRDAQIQEYANIGAAYSQLQADSKRSVQVKPQPNTEVKARKRWTELETGTLIHLVDQFGISWAQIKRWDEQNGHILRDRDQVNLKDKARNIKFDLLKSGHALPKYFDQVTLSASMKQKLAAMAEDQAMKEQELVAHIAEQSQQMPQPMNETNPRVPQFPSAYQPPSDEEMEEEPAFET
jgi:hypothetical protein